MKTPTTNSADVIGQMVADHLQCDTLTVPEMEELVKLLRQCTTHRNYEALGMHCARALLAQLRGQVLTRQLIRSAKGQA